MHTIKFITHLPGIWTLKNKRVKWRWYEIVRTSSHFPFLCLVCFNSDKSFLPSSTEYVQDNNMRDDEALLNKIYAKYKHLLSIFPYSALYLYAANETFTHLREKTGWKKENFPSKCSIALPKSILSANCKFSSFSYLCRILVYAFSTLDDIGGVWKYFKIKWKKAFFFKKKAWLFFILLKAHWKIFSFFFSLTHNFISTLALSALYMHC